MRRHSVLVVEDNKLLRWCMSCGLDRDGFCVFAPESVEDVLRLAADSPVDVVVTDLRLPGGHDGFEVLAFVREKSPQAVSILISADADPHLSDRAQRAGFNLVIQKPFPVAEIVGAVRSLAERHRAGVVS